MKNSSSNPFSEQLNSILAGKSEVCSSTWSGLFGKSEYAAIGSKVGVDAAEEPEAPAADGFGEESMEEMEPAAGDATEEDKPVDDSQVPDLSIGGEAVAPGDAGPGTESVEVPPASSTPTGETKEGELEVEDPEIFFN